MKAQLVTDDNENDDDDDDDDDLQENRTGGLGVP